MRVLRYDPLLVPDFDVLTVDKLFRLFGRLLIGGAIEHFGRATDLPLTINEIDPIRGHGALTSEAGGSTTLSQSPVDATGGAVMCLFTPVP
jgi:hypothetical protein